MFVKALRIYFIIAIMCLIGAGTAHAREPQVGLLKVGDKINIMVEGENDLTGFYTVNKAGSIDMPLIGKVFVAGKTPHEAKTIITQKLKDGYLKKPDVSIKEKPQAEKPAVAVETKPEEKAHVPLVQKPFEHAKMERAPPPHMPWPQMRKKYKEGMKKKVYIVGAVKEPGVYKLPRDAGHILNIIALAGGYTDKADTENFEIVRKIDGIYYRKQAQTGALEYHDGDIVIIEER